MKLIDCTIRDGGHNNSWKFPENVVLRSFQAANKAKVDYFEIGYANPQLPENGPFYSVDDALLDKVIPVDDYLTKLLVMVDTSKANISRFPYAGESRIRGVRVAAYPHELGKAMGQVEELLSKGYEVFLNPMASSELKEAHFHELSRWRGLGSLRALYIADSFGCFMPAYVKEFIQRLRGYGVKKVGFHAHNNLQMAVANTLAAIEGGADFIDATIYGMGRGAGNAPIEIITSQFPEYEPFPYLEEVAMDYRDTMDWGARPEFVLGGICEKHPYYGVEAAKYMGYAEAYKMLMASDLPVNYDGNAISARIGEWLR